MPFEQVPDLVASRRVFLRRGLAYVAKDQIASLVVAHFRARLAKVPHAYSKLLVFCSDSSCVFEPVPSSATQNKLFMAIPGLTVARQATK